MKLKPLLLTVTLLPLASPIFAGVRTVDNTETIVYKPTAFSIENTSLWSADGPQSLSVDWALSEKQWDSVFGRPPRARLGVGSIIDECVLGVCVKAGAMAGLQAEVYVLPYLTADLNPGTFDAIATYQPSVKYQFEGLGVDFFKLETDSGFDADNSSFTVFAPSIKLETGLNINAGLSLFAEACLLGCFLDETIPLISAEFKLPLLEVDTINSTAKIFSPPTDIPTLVELLIDLAENPPNSFEELAGSVLYDDISAVLARGKGLGEAQWESYKADLEEKGKQGDTASKDKLDKINTAEGFIKDSPLTLAFSNPYTSNSDGVWGGTSDSPLAGDVAGASIGGDFIDLRLDVDKVLGYALGLPNGGTISLEDLKIKNSPVDVELTLFDIQAGPSINLETELTLAPELMVTMDFSAPVLIKGEIGTQTSYTGLWSDIPKIALLAPDANKNDVLIQGVDLTGNGFSADSKQAQLFQYSEVVTATPTFSVDATLSNRTYLDVAVGAEISGLGASVGIDGFGSIDIGPVFEFSAESQSLAQVDIYNATFAVNGWDVNGLRNIGATTTPENYDANNPSKNPIEYGNTIASEQLRFDSAGEIIFQARSVGKAAYDIAYTDGVLDSRIKQFMTVRALIDDEKVSRMYEYTPFENTEIITRQLFEFENNLVANSVNNQYTIDAGQRAQVMTDGQLVNYNDGKNLVIEVGGSLELAAQHPYGGETGASNNGLSYGLYNSGNIDVYGDIYMGADALGEDAADRYLFNNTGQVSIGPDGSIKFDGKFANASSGKVSNYGRFELTGTDNENRGTINNKHGAELDLFGKLTVFAKQQGGQPPELKNDGTLTLYTGAELVLDTSINRFRATELTNNGSVIIQKNSELILRTSAYTDPSAYLTNTHVIENSGTIVNEAGNSIINGKSGADWSAYRSESNMLAMVKAQREAALGGLDAAYSGANDDVRGAAYAAAGDKQRFISAINSYMTSAEIKLDKPKPGTGDGYEGYKTIYDEEKAKLATQQAAYDTFKDYYDLQTATIKAFLQPTLDLVTARLASQQSTVNSRKAAFEQQIEFKISSWQKADRQFARATKLRGAESAYGESLYTLAEKREIAAGFYQEIETKLKVQAEAGVGILVNKKSGLLVNEGNLTNHAIVLNEAKGEMYNDTGGNINNQLGYIRNNGLLVNQAGATISNTGVIDNGMQSIRETFGILDIAKLVNLGELHNQGELVNNDTLLNFGTINNQAKSAAASSSSVLRNTGVMSNLGQINNDTILDNKAGAELNNHGTIVNNGTLINDGVFNNGQDPTSNPKFAGQTYSVGSVISDALQFYRQKQNLRSLDNSINKLSEQIKDSKAREKLVTLNLLPNVNGGFFSAFINAFINIQNSSLKIAYEISLATAKAQTTAIQSTYYAQVGAVGAANNLIMNLDSVDRKSYVDANGNAVAGEAFINLASVTSVNTANIENNGTIVNRGLLNNLASITNNANGNITNSGILMLAKTGQIDNAGELTIESVSEASQGSANKQVTYEQGGMLISNGTINNTNTIDIMSGTIINGTLAERTASINNSGSIKLSGSIERSTNALTGAETAIYRTASLINQATINNQSGGSITIGEQSSTLANQQAQTSVNMLANMGQINNQAGASIENHGMLYNAGMIDNQSGSNFTNTGLLNNTASGEIAFADSTTLGGDVVNNGMISMSDGELLILTGSISGSGTFAADTLLSGATVNPGNSPGLLTFAGDMIARNVNWVMEIWGTERGFDYDAVDIIGDLSFEDMSFSILSLIDLETLKSQEFNFISITGDLFNSFGEMMVGSFAFAGFSDEMEDNWAGTWVNNALGGWSLSMNFIGENLDIYANLPTIRALSRNQNGAVNVPAPTSLLLFLSGVLALLWRSRK